MDKDKRKERAKRLYDADVLGARKKAAANARRRRVENPVKERTYANELYARNKRQRLVTRARARAKRLGLPYNITVDDIKWLTHCPILGCELDYVATGGHKKNSPSLDKVVPPLGYVKGNVRVISWEANSMKRNCTDPMVFERMAQYIRGEI